MLFLYFNGYEYNPLTEESVEMALAIANKEIIDIVEIAK